VFGGSQTWKNFKSAVTDCEIVEAAPKVAAAELDHFQLPERSAVRGGSVVQGENAVSNALELQIRAFGGSIIKKQDGATTSDEELLQCQDLTAISQ
jgi:hypothetical protein